MTCPLHNSWVIFHRTTTCPWTKSQTQFKIIDGDWEAQLLAKASGEDSRQEEVGEALVHINHITDACHDA